MYRVRYTNQAEIDLGDAISHIAKENITNAQNYLSRYESKIELLKLNPQMGVECKNKFIKRECKILVHESHIIIYKILTKTSELLLVRIFHGSVDYANKFNSKNFGEL
ncbi:MAG: type II toxin-antitoxin system RelE/ParE family toxin [Sulfurimonas sp.]|uniref:type II toxin-antitoxin system RelE/ParE family toxin n=1 Tax=Sulfurimonas sp. TaxID=2022749 RepID=UPI0025DA43B1|nr:type II toxin-antitoxin system RelE/ParE family toxin [Sulfurimonas sp.]MCK9491387.1 type II toxin-antitoxin system RelE/ParE family toxin [Sulfurimonas sp.]